MDEKVRKRRAAFDREEGVAIAQSLFHARGYDAVSVADLTAALGISPPSLYAAYGSKAELFERAMKRYAQTEALSLDKILAPGRPPAEALTSLFIAATKQYTRNDTCRGCMVTEGMRADDGKAREMAAEIARGSSEAIIRYVKEHNPKNATRISDYVLLTLRGISSYACLGHSQKRLIECAKMAGRTLDKEFGDGAPA